MFPNMSTPVNIRTHRSGNKDPRAREAESFQWLTPAYPIAASGSAYWGSWCRDRPDRRSTSNLDILRPFMSQLVKAVNACFLPLFNSNLIEVQLLIQPR